MSRFRRRIMAALAAKELPAAYRRLTGIIYDGNVYYATSLRLEGSDTLRLSFMATANCNVIGCYTTSSATTNYSLYVSTTSGSKYLRYGGGTYNSYIATDTRYDVVITPTGCDGMRVDSSWSAKTFTAVSDMLIGSTSVGATSAKLTGTLYGDIEVVGRAVFIPVERISDGEIGYYNTADGSFLENQGSGTPVKLGYA
jgi:hypothetical protein